MAFDPNLQWVRHSLTHSLRNQRMLDRTQLRGKTMQSASAAFEMFEGTSPDYYAVSGFLTTYNGTTRYSNTVIPVTAFAKVQVASVASGSILLYENGAKHQGPVPSGTVLLDPRAFQAKSFGFSRNATGRFTPVVDPTYTVSGEITVTIQSGQIKNFTF